MHIVSSIITVLEWNFSPKWQSPGVFFLFKWADRECHETGQAISLCKTTNRSLLYIPEYLFLTCILILLWLVISLRGVVCFTASSTIQSASTFRVCQLTSLKVNSRSRCFSLIRVCARSEAVRHVGVFDWIMIRESWKNISKLQKWSPEGIRWNN